jgi:hypothetical protein
MTRAKIVCVTQARDRVRDLLAVSDDDDVKRPSLWYSYNITTHTLHTTRQLVTR